MATDKVPDTGNTATLALSAHSFTADWMEVGGNEQEIDKIETSHLGTGTYKTFVVGDLHDPGELEITTIFYTTVILPPTTVDTMTLTYPHPYPAGAGATLAGTGFFTKRSFAPLKNNELQQGTYTWAFDGVTGPTWTVATTA